MTLEAKPLVFQVVWHLHAAKRICLAKLVQLESITTTAHLLTVFPAIGVITDPPDTRARTLLVNAAFLLLDFSGHGLTP